MVISLTTKHIQNQNRDRERVKTGMLKHGCCCTQHAVPNKLIFAGIFNLQYKYLCFMVSSLLRHHHDDHHRRHIAVEVVAVAVVSFFQFTVAVQFLLFSSSLVVFGFCYSRDLGFRVYYVVDGLFECWARRTGSVRIMLIRCQSWRSANFLWCLSKWLYILWFWCSSYFSSHHSKHDCEKNKKTHKIVCFFLGWIAIRIRCVIVVLFNADFIKLNCTNIFTFSLFGNDFFSTLFSIYFVC